MVLRRPGPLLATVNKKNGQTPKQRSIKVQPNQGPAAQPSSSKQQTQQQVQQQTQKQLSGAGAVPIRTSTVLQDADTADPSQEQQQGRWSGLQQASNPAQQSTSGRFSDMLDTGSVIRLQNYSSKITSQPGSATVTGPMEVQQTQQQQQGLQQQAQQLQEQQRRSPYMSNSVPARASSTPDKLSVPQRYRQARASQVVPVPEQYVAAARAADKANAAFTD